MGITIVFLSIEGNNNVKKWWYENKGAEKEITQIRKA